MPAGSRTHRVRGRARSVPRRIRPGAPLREVCEAVEDEIHRRGGALAFPVQSSRNDVAAHYCPSPEDETLYATGDLAKLDLGVHVDGWVVDTALTVNVGGVPREPAAGRRRRGARCAPPSRPPAPGVPVRAHLRRDRARRIRGARAAADAEPVRPRRRALVGALPAAHPQHRWQLRRYVEGRARSSRSSRSRPTARATSRRRHARGLPARSRAGRGGRAAPEVVDAIVALRGLPFARRQLAAFPASAVEETLAWLKRYARLTVVSAAGGEERPQGRAGRAHDLRLGGRGRGADPLGARRSSGARL